jgi:hypothetical protein
MWGLPSSITATDPCRGCQARAACVEAVRSLQPVRCENRPAKPQPARRRSYHQYEQHLTPGEVFTATQLARRIGADPKNARAWCTKALSLGAITCHGTAHNGRQAGPPPRLYRYNGEGRSRMVDRRLSKETT